jgi:hypothetical protein
MPVNGGAAGSVSSTSSPPMVSACASSFEESGGLTKLLSQDSGNFIFQQFFRSFLVIELSGSASSSMQISPDKSACYFFLKVTGTFVGII